MLIMQEFASVSASTHQALTESLNAKASDGWSLVSIHPQGAELVAFLSREKKTAAQPVADTSSPVSEPAGWANAPAATTPTAQTVEAPTASTTVTEPAAQPAAQASPARSGNPPANWYADPSGRYELRYWDGNQWTEHVSRGGQQFTDPPLA